MNTAFQKTTASDEWYTPKELVDALGVFDLDPCAPVHPLWKTATRMLNKEDDGLKHDWGEGREMSEDYRCKDCTHLVSPVFMGKQLDPRCVIRGEWGRPFMCRPNDKKCYWFNLKK